MDVTMMIWGEEKSILATADMAGRFIAYRLDNDPNTGFKFGAAHKILHVLSKSEITQILLDPTNTLLLVSTRRSASVWDLETKSQTSHHKFGVFRTPFSCPCGC